MSVHARLWLQSRDEYWLPCDPFALVRLELDREGEYFVPVNCQIIPGVEVKFRVSQWIKQCDRSRHIPYIAICHIRTTPEISTYELLEDLPTVRNWKCMICWHAVIETALETLRTRWPVKTAGYDGPFTLC